MVDAEDIEGLAQDIDMSVLEISGVNKTFGGLRALDDVNLKIANNVGSIHFLN